VTHPSPLAWSDGYTQFPKVSSGKQVPENKFLKTSF
jgi:hypothetical protein